MLFVPLAGAGFLVPWRALAFWVHCVRLVFVVFMSALSVRLAFAYAAGGYF